MTSRAVSISTPTTTTTAFEEDDSPSLRLTIPGAASSESLPTPAATPPPDPTSPTSPAAKRLRTEDVESCRLEGGEVPPPEEDHSETPDAPKGPQITVVLGHGGATEEFSADEEVLCKLPFFALALREGYRETVTKVVRMPDDDPELVQCLLQYLTTGEYKVPSSAVLVMGTSMSTQCKKETRMRLKLFHTSVLILADKYMCVGLSKLAALNLRKIVLSPMSFVNYMVSVYEMTPPGSPLRIGYFVDYGYKDELLVVHPQWTISSHTRASITRLLESQNTEDRFVDALDRCPQLAIDLVALISKGKQPVGRAILQCPGAAKFLLLHHCKQFYDKRPWTSKGEIVTVPWGWWKGLC